MYINIEGGAWPGGCGRSGLAWYFPIVFLLLFVLGKRVLISCKICAPRCLVIAILHYRPLSPHLLSDQSLDRIVLLGIHSEINLRKMTSSKPQKMIHLTFFDSACAGNHMNAGLYSL